MNLGRAPFLGLAVFLGSNLLPGHARADDFAWGGRGTIRLSVPAGWQLASKDGGENAYLLRAQPKAGATVVAQITLAALPPGRTIRPDQVKDVLEAGTQEFLAGSVEKTFDPKPLAISGGSGWFVQLTDASLVGKPPQPGNFKVMRSAMATLGDGVMLIATITFDDPSRPEVSEAMSLLSSVRLERGAVVAPAAVRGTGPFEFTVPQSRVVVKVPDEDLRRDDPPPGTGPNSFLVSKKTPTLMISGWLEPASQYQGLEAFWKSESSSPSYAGAAAPTRVEMTKVGPWEVVAYDIPLSAMGAPSGATSAHVRAERVHAGTWVDLHLSSTGDGPAAALREGLVRTLRAIEVVEK